MRHSILQNLNITVFVTGGVASYKAAELARRLIKKGAYVRVAMTKNATEFVTPLLFQSLTRQQVFTDTFDEKDPEVISHIHLADWTELAVVVPATANIIGKMANGIADDFVSTTLLAVSAPIIVAPAMNTHMYENPAVQRNMRQLEEDGVRVIEPATGMLAEGYEGKGRLPEPEDLVDIIEAAMIDHNDYLPLKGKRILISAGGTREKIDPVRYLTNASSGKMGYALAEAAHNLGAEVVLVSTTKDIKPPYGIRVEHVKSANEMARVIYDYYPSVDVVIMAAAVSDFRPDTSFDNKIKKSDDGLTIRLTKNPDILKNLGSQKEDQFLIGFAAETQDLTKYAQGKLVDKNADMIVGNDVSTEYSGFDVDNNEVIIFQPNEEPIRISLRSKLDIAYEILDILVRRLDSRH